ncbi:MAG: MmcQ/YjbR family DNA-binding protein [Acidimicrobiales bacterium]
MAAAAEILRNVRRACLALPEVTERLSHGAPSFFVQGKRAFVNLWVNGHHDLEFPHLWCAGGPGEQESLVASDPATFFRPPYVGHRGWIGVRLHGRPDWDQVADLCEEAYRVVAPARLVRLLDEDG